MFYLFIYSLLVFFFLIMNLSFHVVSSTFESGCKTLTNTLVHDRSSFLFLFWHNLLTEMSYNAIMGNETDFTFLYPRMIQ